MYWCSLPVGAPVVVVAGFVLPSTIVVKLWEPNKPPSFTPTGLTPQSPMFTLQSQRQASGPQRLNPPFPFIGILPTAKGVKTLYPTSCLGSTARYPRSFRFRSFDALLPRHDLTLQHLQ
jgi:hypothetical protein